MLLTLTETDGVSVAFSPDSRWLASSAFDKTVKLFDPGSGALIRTMTLDTGSPEALAFSPESRWIAAGVADGAEYNARKGSPSWEVRPAQSRAHSWGRTA